MSSRHISIGKEYMRILLLTHPNKTVSHDHGDGSDNVSRKEYAQNRIISDHAQSLLGRRFVTSVSLLNRCTTEDIHTVTPHEEYFETKVDLSHLKNFGNIEYLHIPGKKR